MTQTTVYDIRMRFVPNFLTNRPQVWTAGQVIGIINDIPTCEELISRIEREAIETLSKATSMIVDKQPEPDIAGKPMGDISSDPRSDHGKKVPGEAEIYDIGKAKL